MILPINDNLSTPIITKRAMLGLPTEYVAPRSAIEKHVARIWSEAFGLDGVGVNDDFFELSGDSLTATTIAVVIASDFNAKFRPGMLMTCSTVALIADYLEQQAGVKEEAWMRQDLPLHLVPVRTEGNLKPLFIIHGRFGISFPRKSFIDGLSSDQPLYFIQAIGYMGEELPPPSLGRWRRTMCRPCVWYNPRVRSISALCAGGMIAVEIARHLTAAGQPPANIVMIDPAVPFSLQQRSLPVWVRRSAHHVRKHWRRARGSIGFTTNKHKRISEKIEEYRTRDPVEKIFQVEVVSQAQERLEDAFVDYRPNGYPGIVDIIASRDQAPTYASDSAWGKLLPNIKLHIIGDSHRELLKTDAGKTAQRLQLILTGAVDA